MESANAKDHSNWMDGRTANIHLQGRLAILALKTLMLVENPH